jgi:hypothetical protein
VKRNRILRWLTVAGLTLGLVGANLVAAAPAGAWVPGLARWSTTVPGGAVAVSATVLCPSSHLVYGTGFEIAGANGTVHVVSVLPNAALTSVTAIAVPRSMPPPGWTLTVYAICARPSPQQHLEMAGAASWIDNEVCNAATRVYGVGGRQTGHPTWTFREIVPIAPAAPPLMSEASLSPSGGAPGVASAAICALPLPTLKSIDSGFFAVGNTVMCPAGERVHGPGGEVLGANPGVVIEGIVPNAALTQVRVTAVNGAAPWATRAFAVCA